MAVDLSEVVVIDNYDSFTYNLLDYVSEHVEPSVRLNTTSLEAISALDPAALVISPGPGHPANDRDVGVTVPVLEELSPRVPTLGVCLGLEAAVHTYDGSVGRAPEPVHGKASPIDHDGDGVFRGVADGFQGGRYHSLVATDVPDCFEITATTRDHGAELVMGVRHRGHPIEAVQFHPESVLTGPGRTVIRNFLEWAADQESAA